MKKEIEKYFEFDTQDINNILIEYLIKIKTLNPKDKLEINYIIQDAHKDKIKIEMRVITTIKTKIKNEKRK